MMRIPFETMCAQFERVLESRNMNESDAALCARLIAETSLEGVYTMGRIALLLWLRVLMRRESTYMPMPKKVIRSGLLNDGTENAV